MPGSGVSSSRTPRGLSPSRDPEARVPPPEGDGQVFGTVEGGLPLVINGLIVGAIGLSGGTSAQDGQCAKAGADALL